MSKFPNTCKDLEYRLIIDLLDNLIPATLDIYAILFRSGSFNQYLETLFRIWTFALRWRRKNYNKAPLAFLSDYYYWKDNGHIFSEVMESYLANFNDYYVENIHSQIRNNTTSLHSPEAIINQAYLLDLHDQKFINEFKKYHHYPYNEPMLEELTTKTSLFLLKYFHSIYNNVKHNNIAKKSKNNSYKLPALNVHVDLRSLPAGYHTSFPPNLESCDHCKRPFENDEGIILICGHGYHANCHNNKLRNICRHCEEFYKKGVFKNVSSFVKRLEGGPDILTEDDVEEEIEEEDDGEDEANVPNTSSNLNLGDALESVKEWMHPSILCTARYFFSPFLLKLSP